MTGNQVREIRQKLHLTQQDFASMLGLSFVSVNRWENGHSIASDLCLVLLDQLSKVLDIHPAKMVLQRIRKASDSLPLEQNHKRKGVILSELYWLEWEPPNSPELQEKVDDTDGTR